MFDETKHPRAKDGKFTGKESEGWDFDEESQTYTSKDGEVFSEKDYKEKIGGEEKTEEQPKYDEEQIKADAQYLLDNGYESTDDLNPWDRPDEIDEEYDAKVNEELKRMKGEAEGDSGMTDAISKANESKSKMNVTEPVKEVEHDDIYDESKKDKYGNPMLSEKYREIGKEAAKRYVDDMLKYDSMEQLTNSFVFAQGIMDEFSDAVHDATDWQAELTEKELEDIVSEVTGYDFDYQTFESHSGKPYFRKK